MLWIGDYAVVNGPKVKQAGGTPQGPPVSPALFTIYIIHMITEAQVKIDKE